MNNNADFDMLRHISEEVHHLHTILNLLIQIGPIHRAAPYLIERAGEHTAILEAKLAAICKSQP